MLCTVAIVGIITDQVPLYFHDQACNINKQGFYKTNMLTTVCYYPYHLFLCNQGFDHNIIWFLYLLALLAT